MLTTSVIIPTLNEAVALPTLLDALYAQSRRPDEIIVADAGSNDATPQLAAGRGATVVAGGLPAAGRNSGARAASGDLLIFLDADVLPRPDFIEKAVGEFVQANYAVATCLIEAISNRPADYIIAEATNLYLQVVQYFSPHAPGFCIFARRATHFAIGGFDEKVKLAEDHDYVQRASRLGEFGVITSTHIPVSMRRLEKEGLTRLAFKYLWCEMHALAGKPIYSLPFEYEFGAHLPAASPQHLEQTRRIIDIGKLRDQLGRFENPVQRFSAGGLATLEKLMRPGEGRHKFWLPLDPPDITTLQRYLLRRLAVIRREGRPLAHALSKFQSLPLPESVRLLDLNWLKTDRHSKE